MSNRLYEYVEELIVEASEDESLTDHERVTVISYLVRVSEQAQYLEQP